MPHLDDGRLQAWLDRPRSGLAAREAEAIEAHLEACEECARRLAELGDVGARADAILSSVEPKDTTVPEYREVVARSRRGDRRPRSRWVALAWAASVVLALGVGWLTNDLRRDRRVAVNAEQAAVEAPDASDASDAAAATGGAPARGGSSSVAERGRAATPIAGEPGSGAEAEEGRVADAAPGPPASSDRPAAAEEEARVAESPAPSEQAPPSTPPPETSASRVVRGRVTDDRGRPLPSAQVFVEGGRVGGLTDRDGTFSLELPEQVASSDSGLSLTAQRIGYGTATRRIALAGADTVSTSFRLSRQAVALEALRVTGADRRLADDAAGWRSVGRADAEEEAGFAVLTVPGFEILGTEIGALEGAPAVRVRQAIGPGAVLTMVQRRAGGATPAADQADGLATVSTRRGDLLLTATAALPADSLRALLERVR